MTTVRLYGGEPLIHPDLTDEYTSRPGAFEHFCKGLAAVGPSAARLQVATELLADAEELLNRRINPRMGTCVRL